EVGRRPARDGGQTREDATLLGVTHLPSLREHEGSSNLRRIEVRRGRSSRDERRAEEVRVELEDPLAVRDDEDAVAEPHARRRDEVTPGTEAAEASEIA